MSHHTRPIFPAIGIGKVLSKPEGEKVLIRFYDKKECEVKTDDVYVIPAEKYNYDSDKIMKCEEKLVNKVVVARRENTGLFHIGEFCAKWAHTITNMNWLISKLIYSIIVI